MRDEEGECVLPVRQFAHGDLQGGGGAVGQGLGAEAAEVFEFEWGREGGLHVLILGAILLYSGYPGNKYKIKLCKKTYKSSK